MARIGVRLGDSDQRDQRAVGAVAPGGQPEHWMRPYAEKRTPIDWTQEQYQTPKPGPKQKFGKYENPVVDVPQLPEHNIRVKAKAPSTFYTSQGMPIPSDQWVTLPISPGIMQAIKDGDLERGDEPTDDEQKTEHHPRRRHTTETKAG